MWEEHAGHRTRSSVDQCRWQCGDYLDLLTGSGWTSDDWTATVLARNATTAPDETDDPADGDYFDFEDVEDFEDIRDEFDDIDGVNGPD